jgi:hypothetical protein
MLENLATSASTTSLSFSSSSAELDILLRKTNGQRNKKGKRTLNIKDPIPSRSVSFS